MVALPPEIVVVVLAAAAELEGGEVTVTADDVPV
jgi:hypothetical protein